MIREALNTNTFIRLTDNKEEAYQIESVLGRGGTAIIYGVKKKAYDRQEARWKNTSEIQYAIKECFPAKGFWRHKDNTIVPYAEQDESFKHIKEMMTKEFEITNRIYNESFRIIPVTQTADEIEISTDWGRTWTKVKNTMGIMNDVSGKGIFLGQICGAGKMCLKDSLLITQKLLLALQGIHEAGYLHLDIQEGNFVIEKNDLEYAGLYFLDFGSARKREKDGKCASITDRNIYAARGFCAPEIEEKNDGTLRLGPEADLYSAGYLLLSLLAGGKKGNGYLQACRERKSFLSFVTVWNHKELKHNSEVKNRVNEILLSALEADVAKRSRYSVQNMLEQIQDVLDLLKREERLSANHRKLWEAQKHWLKTVRNKGERFENLVVNPKLFSDSQKFGMESITEMKEHLSLVGPGGVGKTTTMFHIMEQAYAGKDYEETAKVPIFIELSGAPDCYEKVYEKERSTYIRRCIYQALRLKKMGAEHTYGLESEIDSVFKMDAKVLTDIDEAFEQKNSSSPQYILLLDGLNEVSRNQIPEVKRSAREMLVEEIERLSACSNVQIVLTSRTEEKAICVPDMRTIYLTGIEEEAIEAYLKECRMSEEQIEEIKGREALWETLEIPLFLLMYVKLKDRGSVVTQGEILKGYFHELGTDAYSAQSRIVEIEKEQKKSGHFVQEYRITGEMGWFFLDFLLPELAWVMERQNSFYLNAEEMEKVLLSVLKNSGEASVCGNYGKKVFSKYFIEFESDTGSVAEAILNLAGGFRSTLTGVIVQACMDLGILYKNQTQKQTRYGFSHHHIRDYFAAVRNINSVRLAVEAQNRSFLAYMDDMPLGFEVRRFMGEILGEHHNTPIDPAPSVRRECDRNLIQRALLLYRNDDREDCGYGVYSFVEILKQVRVDLSGVDFSGLDLRRCSLIDVCLGHKEFGARFQKAKIDPHLFFSEKNGFLSCAAYSPDGRSAAAGNDDGDIIIWDAQIWKPVRTLSEGSGIISSVTYSRNGSYLVAVAESDRCVRIWDTRSWNCLHTVEELSEIPCIAYLDQTENDLLLAYSSYVEAWDLDKKESVSRYVYGTEPESGEEQIAWNADGRQWEVVEDAEEVKTYVIDFDHELVLDYESGLRKIKDTACYRNYLSRHTNAESLEIWNELVSWSCLSPNGSHCAVTTLFGGTVQIWNRNAGVCEKYLGDYADEVWMYSSSFVTDHVLIRTKENRIEKWSLEEGLCENMIGVPMERVLMSPDGKYLLIRALGYGNMLLWDWRNNVLLKDFGKASKGGFDYSQKETVIWLLRMGGTVEIWEADSLECVQTIEAPLSGRPEYKKHFCCDHGFYEFVFHSNEKKALLRDLHGRECRFSIDEIGEADLVPFAENNSKGIFICSKNEKTEVIVLNLETGKVEDRLEEHDMEIDTKFVRGSHDGKYVVLFHIRALDEDTDTDQFLIWDLENRAYRKYEFKDSLVADTNGEVIIYEENEELIIWDFRKNTTASISDEVYGTPQWAEFSSDGRYLWVAHSDVEDGQMLYDLSDLDHPKRIPQMQNLYVHGVDLRKVQTEGSFTDEELIYLKLYGAALDLTEEQKRLMKESYGFF